MFHEMRYVYEVYRRRSFSKAVQALYISQPSLSLMVKKAEARVGVPIFDRSTSPIGLTEAGQEYIRAAEQIMGIEEGFRRYLSDAESCLTGVLSVGGTTLFTSYVLPPLLSAFSAQYPGVEVKLHETHTALLERELREGSLDFVAENYAFDPAIYESRPYLEERLVLTVPATFDANAAAAPYRLTAAQVAAGETRPPVPMALFKEEAFLLLKEGNDTRIRADKLLAQARLRPRVRLLLDQQITAYNLASYGLGITFISDTLIRHVPPDPRLCFYDLEPPLARRTICLVSKRGRFVSRPMRAFLRILA